MSDCTPNIIQNGVAVQQTGPRTVIVPADPIIWNASTNYEYLTLVASENYANGYVSKKDVPAGTPLTDTEYWAPVANFNAQVANLTTELANEVERAKSAESANAAAADNAQTAADNAQTAADNAQTAADNAQTAADNAQTAADNAQTAADNANEVATTFDIVCMGDSLASGIINDGSSPNSQYGWLNYVQQHKPAHVGNVYTNTSTVIAGNTGFTSSRRFIDVITDMVNNVITNKNNVKHVYVSGGTNDASAGSANIKNAVDTFCNYVKTNLPNAEITICHQASSKMGAYTGYRDGAIQNGCRFVNVWPVMSLPDYLSDGTHLTDAGYQATIPYVYNALFGGDDSLTGLYQKIIFDSEDLTNNWSFENSNNGFQYYVNIGNYSVFPRNPSGTESIVLTKTSNTSTPQSIINNFDKYIPGGVNNFFLPCFMTNGTSSGVFMLYFDSADKTLKLPATDITGNVTLTIIPMLQSYGFN